MITGFNHYNLRAPQPLLNELRDFYCNVVGLTLGSRPSFASFGYWLYAGSNDVLHLTECTNEERRLTHVNTTFDHAAFNCADLPAVERRLHQHDVAYRQSVVPLTKRVQLFFSDPAGNGVELNFESEGNS